MSSLYVLREVELAEELAFKLAPLIAAYRPHSRPPTVPELKAAGLERIERESFNEELRELYFENHNFYPEDNPELETLGNNTE